MRYTLWVRIGKRWYMLHTNLAAWQLEHIDISIFDGYWVEQQHPAREEKNVTCA